LHNERIVTLIEPKEGFLCAVVQIGAFLVGSIVHHRLPAPSTHMDGQVLHCSPPPACFAGEELGYFAFGSSVVVLLSAQATLKFPKNRGQMLRCGEPIAIFEEI
jgi:phosphatidylserine decarboxylase